MVYSLVFVLISLTNAKDDDVIITNHLTYHEVLDNSQIKYASIPRDGVDASHIKRVHFHTHHRDLTLNIRQSTDIFTDDFDFTDVNDKLTLIDKNTFYTGYLEGDDFSDVTIRIKNDVITGSIKTKNGTFYMEPLLDYVDGVHAHQMIVYTKSNIRQNIRLRSKTVSNNSVGLFIDSIHGEEKVSNEKVHRARRATASQSKCDNVPEKNICPIYLVADYTFFKYIGQGNLENTIYHMIQAFRVANQILKKTKWNDGIGCHVGLGIKGIEVYETDGPETPRFNRKIEEEVELDHNIYLSRFNKDKYLLPKWNDYKFCLAHVFTYRSFKEDLLGLAYIGEICNEQNVAFSNYFNSARNTRLDTSVANLVTAHEIVHNFGARHDNTDFLDQSACNPEDGNTGNFLMHDTIISGDKDNNDVLSPCSKESVSKILKSRLNDCFVKQNGSFCHNGVVEDKEECDPGILWTDDKCCDKNCRFKGNAQCSDVNHVCCSNCRFTKTRNKICRHRNNNTCHDNIFCDGFTSSCPVGTDRLLSDNSICDFGRGNCINGRCISVCDQRGEKEIACASCYWCCIDSKTNVSQLVRPRMDGVPCSIDKEIGKCVQGSCIKIKKDLNLFKDFTFSKLGRFLKQNIVGTICVFSLFFWAPVACFVNYLDKKQDVEDVFYNQWSHPNNSRLVLDRGARRRLRQFFKKEGGSAKRVSGARFHITS